MEPEKRPLELSMADEKNSGVESEQMDGRDSESLDEARGAVRSTVEAAKEKLSSVGNIAGDVSGGVKEKAGQAGDFAKERYGVAKEKIGTGYSKARKDIDQLAADVNVYVQDNPGRAVLIAAGLGFMVGFLIRRSDR